MKTNRIILFFYFITNCFLCSAQSISELEKEKLLIQKTISKSNILLNKYAKEKEKSLISIQILDQQIHSRQRLIHILNEEISWLNNDIDLLKVEIINSEEELSKLKQQYARLIDKAYRNRQKYNELSFFLGAASFNEAYRKFIIIKEYNKFRKNQGLLIQKQTLELQNKRVLLENKLIIQSNALEKINVENDLLLSNKTSLSRSVSQLQQKESQIKRKIRSEKKALKKLESEIIRLIEESTKETIQFSDFDKSKGNLPKPLKNGVIVKKFGEHQHPVLKYVKVHNNGIDIQSTKEISASCVFDGIVSRVVSIPGYNKAVLIRHGQFLTVYANLSLVTVKKGDKVKIQQNIGDIYIGKGENSGVLHFELWKESKKIDPELWLSK